MAARILRIEHCKQCRYSWHDDVSLLWFCGQRPNAPALEINMLHSIPDWCPLPVAEGEGDDDNALQAENDRLRDMPGDGRKGG